MISDWLEVGTGLEKLNMTVKQHDDDDDTSLTQKSYLSRNHFFLVKVGTYSKPAHLSFATVHQESNRAV